MHSRNWATGACSYGDELLVVEGNRAIVICANRSKIKMEKRPISSLKSYILPCSNIVCAQTMDWPSVGRGICSRLHFLKLMNFKFSFFLSFFINNMMKNVYGIICYTILDSWCRSMFFVFLIFRSFKVKALVWNKTLKPAFLCLTSVSAVSVVCHSRWKKEKKKKVLRFQLIFLYCVRRP